MNEDTFITGMDRRRFLMTAAGVAGLAAAANLGFPVGAQAETVKQPPLPWAQDALEPYISGRTISYHYGKHHAGYVRKTNEAVKGTDLEGAPLPKIIMTAFGTDMYLYNNSAQVWNHTFYWNCMKPDGGGMPSKTLGRELDRAFGSYDGFVKKFKEAAGIFGSGYAWLVQDSGRLRVINTPNADTPIAHGLNPLLTIDCWEHAYYLDYQNARGKYVDAFLNNLVDWRFVESNM